MGERQSRGRWIRVLAAAAALAAVAGPAAAQEGSEGDPSLPHADGEGNITFALTGDAIITRALRPYEEPEFLDLRRIVRGATAAFTNLEVLFHDYGPDLVPQEESGGTYMRADPELAGDLAWMGFDLVSRANNHTMDFGVAGMRTTTRAVERAGLVHAGAGENLALACEPAYLETAGGRVALVSVASTFDDHMRAGEARPDFRGRPGLCPLRYETRYTVPRRSLEALREIRRGMGWSAGGDTAVRFFGATFVAGAEFGRSARPREEDVRRALERIRDADRQANWVVVSSHTHESAGPRDVAASFLETFARRAVDAGADVVVGHGPHVLRGIEVYRGRPIFYSLGNFIFQNETVLRQPADNYERYGLPPSALPGEFQDRRVEVSGGGFPADPEYWEGAVAVPRFRGGELAEVRLYPVTLGHGLDRPQRGRPLLAPEPLAQKIVSDLAERSERYGTRVEERDGVAVVPVRRRAGEGGSRR